MAGNHVLRKALRTGAQAKSDEQQGKGNREWKVLSQEGPPVGSYDKE